MFEPVVEVSKWLYSLVPTKVRSWKFQLNFILVHYTYLIGMSIIGSVILYGAGVIGYTNALFFAAGSATQSGLNTINVNDLELYQQITCYMIANVCNPIFINTVVVFVRLYWFEKRFERVVKDIRAHRRSRMKTMTRSKSDMKEEDDLHRLELGVNGREIKVLHETTVPNGMTGTTADTKEEAQKFKEKMGLRMDEESVEPTPEGSNKSSTEGAEESSPDEKGHQDEATDEKPSTPVSASSEHNLGLNPAFHREITFADELKDPDRPEDVGVLAQVPEHQDMSKHISFLQRQQRNAREGNALRIPGPRAFERGETPQQTVNLSEEDLHRPQTRNTLTPIKSESEREGVNTEGTEKLNGDDHPERGNIRFDEQEHPGRLKETPTFEDANTTNSRFGMSRIRSGVGSLVHRRRTNTNNHLHLSEVPGTLGRTFSTLTTVRSRERPGDPMPYLSWQATTGRNSAFLGLTEEQREELGGIEYRALKTLAKVLILYFLGFHIFGVVIFLPWIVRTNPWKAQVLSYAQNPSWWAIFTTASLFNDLGLTLTPNSMYDFKTSVLVMLLGTFLIIIGNTGFPVMLRFVIWVGSKLAPYGSGTWEELRFLLDHPRRCFTLLFPSKATWWLFWILVLLNGIDLVFYIILDLHDPTVTDVAGGYRFLDGLFQAASTRTAGFACVNIANLHPAIQVSYMVMMYISVFPIAISIRRTNVYEEKSLGMWGGEEDAGDGDTDPSYVGQHLRRQLSFDLWYIFLGFFLIAIIEGDRLANSKDTAFTMFSVLFEIVSAYGTVGLSLGYTGIDASFSTEFRPLSKLIVCAMMIRGRHRGLPYALDRAILLPSEKLQKKESEDANRRARRGSVYAEGNETERSRTGPNWSSGDLDEYGLPRQHLGHAHASTTHASATHASAVSTGDDQSPESRRSVRRVASGMSAASANGPTKRERRRSLSRVIVGGLSAGPSFSKHD